MKNLIIKLENTQITSPEYPNECSFIEIATEKETIKLTQELFTDYDTGAKTLSNMIQSHCFKTHVTTDFGTESFINCGTGVKFCIGDDYVRFVNAETLKEYRSKYWTVDEFVEDFESVAGAIVGCLCSNESELHL